MFQDDVAKRSFKIPECISEKVLTVGPEYREHRGGVGAVIELYSRYFEKFNFIGSYKKKDTLFKIIIFLKSIIKIFFKLISDKKIRIVHIHGASNGSFYRKFIIFILAKYLFRKKVIYHIHGGGYREFYKNSNFISKKLVGFFLKRADLIVCVSRSWADYFGKNLKLGHVVFLPNMIGYPEKMPDNRDSSEITLLFLGLICNGKGIFDLLEVIATNKEKYRGKIRLFVGGNGEAERLQDLIKKDEISDMVEYLGWVSNRDKIEALSRSQIYVLPSYTEGMPVSVLEAMSYGMAIIATNVGGIPELVRDKENGLLVEPGNLKQLQKALDWFILYPELIIKYGSVSEANVEKHLPGQVIKELIGIYRSLLPEKALFQGTPVC